MYNVYDINFINDKSSYYDVNISYYEGVNGSTVTTNRRLLSNVSTSSNRYVANAYTALAPSSWYTTIATFHHLNSGETTSRTLYTFTHTKPSISNLSILNVSNSSEVSIFSPQDSTAFKWYTNARIWSGEGNFVTYINIDGSSVTNNADTTNSGPWNNAPYNSNIITTTPSGKYTVPSSDWAVSSLTSGGYNVQNIFDVNKRSVAQLPFTLNVGRVNPSVGVVTSTTNNYYAYVTTSVTIQYQPTQSPANDTVTDGINDVQGKTVAIHKVPTITVGWTYNHYAGAAGVVNGYKVVIMNDTKTQIKQTKYYSKTALSSPVSITLNTATELFIGKMNYARVTPYYFKPNQSGTVTDDTKIILGTQSYDIKLVKPYYKMDAPVIQYPINNTIWHNKDFRILCTMPEDPNFEGYTQAQQNNYQYGNIQVEISTDGGTLKFYDYTNVWTGATNSYEDCFSSLLSDYKQNKAIWLNRTDGDVITSGTYKIRMRAQMPNYIFTNEEMQDNSDDSPAWSDWSNTVNITVVAVNKQNLVKGNKIYASEYATVQDYIKRLLRCYPMGQDVTESVNVGDIIYRNEYTSIYNTITNLITGVNSYCTFTNNGTVDRRDIQLAYGTKALPSFTALQEIILAAETGVDDNGSTGRNYKNILTGYMIDCLK